MGILGRYEAKLHDAWRDAVTAHLEPGEQVRCWMVCHAPWETARRQGMIPGKSAAVVAEEAVQRWSAMRRPGQPVPAAVPITFGVVQTDRALLAVDKGRMQPMKPAKQPNVVRVPLDQVVAIDRLDYRLKLKVGYFELGGVLFGNGRMWVFEIPVAGMFDEFAAAWYQRRG